MSVLGFLALGFAAGMVHFTLLRWNTLLYARGGALAPAIGAQALRMAVTGAVLFTIAMHGALALLLAAGGMLIARPLVLRFVP